ncbi:MAG: helix-turn-helix transcriptional regulator [Clostridiales bacterium]|nr:helix-turn-helix transcriptional regulator [Clostridiales bacterium]
MFDKLLPVLEDSMKNDSGSMPVVFEGMERIIEKKEANAEMSVHNFHELFYLRSGKVEFIFENTSRIIEPNTTLIIKPYTKHKIRVISKTADTMGLYFGFSKPNNPGTAQPSLESFLEFAGIEDNGTVQDYNSQSFIILSGSYKKSIGSLLDRIVDEQKEDEVNKDLMMEVLTVELMLILSRAMKKEWEDSLKVRTGKARELVLLACDYIDENYERGITVAQAASYVFLSQGYFTRAFRDEIGVSPMTYLMRKRISKACELLENDEIKVSGIASQAGFSSPQRFNVAFKKQMGMTPLEYRRSKIGKGE